MTRKLFSIALFTFTFSCVNGQDISTYLKDNAVRVENPDALSDSVYHLISPFQIIMMGEMHGTNEPAQFVFGLTELLTIKGDSVQVGLEIPSGQMTQFLQLHTDSSIYNSDFFLHPKYKTGKESFAWAGLISKLRDDPKVQIFFFDVNDGESKPIDRDSMMYIKIKKQLAQHPTWKMITLGGNVHNKISGGGKTIAFYLKQDTILNLSAKICSLNHYYLKGTCRANFGDGLEEKLLERPESAYDTTFNFDKYIVLVSTKSTYPYTGLYYTKYINAAKMVSNE